MKIIIYHSIYGRPLLSSCPQLRYACPMPPKKNRPGSPSAIAPAAKKAKVDKAPTNAPAAKGKPKSTRTKKASATANTVDDGLERGVEYVSLHVHDRLSLISDI